ncbi:MAG: STAS domain-containing protein [Terriglobales bacterium]|jgi:anti-anti-sigma factor
MDDRLTVVSQTDPTGKVSTLKLTGPLLSTNVQPFKAKLHEVTTPGLVIDLSEVDHVDSVGVGALVHAQITRKKSGKTLVLAAVGERVMAVLKGTQVDLLFRFAATQSEAQTIAAGG